MHEKKKKRTRYRREKEGGGKKIWKKLWTNGTAARIGFSRAIESKGSNTVRVRRRAFTLRLSNVYTDERTRGKETSRFRNHADGNFRQSSTIFKASNRNIRSSYNNCE